MVAELVRFSLVYASLMGMAGFVLALLAWEIFRGSPFGVMMAGLAAIMFVLATFHGLLLVLDRLALPALESAAFTALLVWTAGMIYLHQKLARKPGVG